VLLLLPPSEGKAVPADGPPVDLAALTFPELAPLRQELATALVRLCRSRSAARTALSLGPTQDDAVDANRRVLTAPTLPAARLYTGVLHEALGFSSLPVTVRRRAAGHALVFSGLWGAVRYDDRLPHYRLPITARIGRPLAAAWRPVLAAPVAAAAGAGLVVDLRSAPYAKAWQPTPELAGRVVAVSVLAERRAGRRVETVRVSHFNKASKGRFARELLLSPTDDPAALTERAAAAGLHGSVVAAPSGYRLDLVEPLEGR